MDATHHKLEPAFGFEANEPSLVLHKGLAKICIDGHTFIGEGEVRLDLLPQAGIHLYSCCPADEEAVKAHLSQKEISSFSIDGLPIKGFMLSSDVDAHYRVKWCPTPEPINGVGDETTKMTWLVFHLFNFVDLVGTRRSIEQIGSTAHAIQHVDLVHNEWRVDLKSLLSTKDSINVLRKEGGHRLTHIGGIQKTDGSPFSGREADEFLNAIRFFLSFAKGGWCDPICAVGFDDPGKRVWVSWSSPRVRWYLPSSWFDPHTGSQLVSLLPGFMRRWADEDLREALREVIYWYLNANCDSRGIDAGIILTQTAIERLSYDFVVRDRRLMTAEGFKNLWASDKFRLLFSSLRLPLGIPPETPQLQGLAVKGQMNWLDAPHALTEIRNSLVHPEHKRREKLNATYEVVPISVGGAVATPD
jgi:hypothetical protein